MAERKTPSRISNAEIKAGVFLTFCLALFVAMLFVLGKFGRTWRGKQEINVVFTEVNALGREAPVRYNGMDVGHVKKIKIEHLDDALLARLPVFTRAELGNLPLTSIERETVAALPEDKIDAEARTIIRGRTVVLLTLELLAENDTQRYRVDDEYRISGSLVGDSSVEINTGAGQVIPEHYDKVLLGVGGDMYTDLGKSISQVKDILGSMAEMVGGDANRKSIQEQLTSFENFTGKIENASDSMITKLPELWDKVDERVNYASTKMDEVQARMEKIKPDLEKTMEGATKSIAEIRQRTASSVQEVYERIADYRKRANEGLAEWRTLAADYRESIPEQVKNAREWSDRFAPTVDKIDQFFSRADDQLNTGIESTRASLQEYSVMAGNLEETTYRIKRWPWSLANRPEDEAAQQQHLEWQRDLARRQYVELRNEMERLQATLSGVGSTDRSRAARITQLIRESDLYFGVSPGGAAAPAPAPAPAAPPKKGAK